jgi:hypothetical protein
MALSSNMVHRASCSLALRPGSKTISEQDFSGGRVRRRSDDLTLFRSVLHFGVEVEHALDPSERSGLGPLLAIYPDTLGEVSVDGLGTLRLRFGGGASITVPANPRWEALQIVGPGTALVVCSPGGPLAVWT